MHFLLAFVNGYSPFRQSAANDVEWRRRWWGDVLRSGCAYLIIWRPAYRRQVWKLSRSIVRKSSRSFSAGRWSPVQVKSSGRECPTQRHSLKFCGTYPWTHLNL